MTSPLGGFPTKLGFPQAQYQVQPDDNVIRTAMERGHKARRVFDDARFNYVFTFIFTNEQLHYFRAWWKHKINDGAEWYNMPVRENAATATLEARPLMYYESDAVGNNQHHSVTIACETRTDNIPTEAAFDAWNV